MSLMNAIFILSLFASLNHIHHVGFNKNNPYGIISFIYREIKNSLNLTNTMKKKLVKKFDTQIKNKDFHQIFD